MSARGVINDLSSRTQILQSELSYLERDSRTMYEEWRGIAGGGAASAGGESASAWRLMTRVSRLIERLKSASGEIQKQEASWWKLRKALQNEAGAEGDVQNTAGGFDVLKNGLRGIVGRVEAIDIEIEKLQEEFDFVQRDVYAYLAKEFPKAGAAPSDPWHRQYEYQRTPRVLPRYDFEEVYARYMREAHESLHTSWNKPKARDGRVQSSTRKRPEAKP
ncbi:MAG: hypothetical protein Q8T11_15780 [Elusimicrobiota bacterium]|nr:hypothetical protein [Elusimicrobiota bacterium]